MKTIEGDDNYILYKDEKGNVYDGEFVDSNTSIVTNLEDVSNDKIEIYTP